MTDTSKVPTSDAVADVGSSKDSYLERLQSSFASSHPRSMQYFQDSCAVMPGGNSRTPLFHEPFPCYLDKGIGSRVQDVDGFEYVDMVNNYTSLVHGHPTPNLVESLAARAAIGTALGAPSPLEVEHASEIVTRIPSVECVRFANSGTEATLYAIRTARAFTGRDQIIKMEGGYHGGAEMLQVSVKTLGRPNQSIAEPGAPLDAERTTHVIPFNEVDTARELIALYGPTSAALIVEPVQGGAGAMPAQRDYLRMLREMTEKTGCLLLFDEVMTLRLSYGGMQEEFGVFPDLTALGKVIGGGLPVGAFGGRRDIMDVWDPKATHPAYHAGTFNANPLTAVAGLDSLRRLTRDEIARINGLGDALRERICDTARSFGVTLVASGWGSVLQVHSGSMPPRSYRDSSTRPKEIVRLFHLLMLKNGVFIAPRGAMNVSTSMDGDDLEQVESAVVASIREMSREGVT